MDEKVKRLIEWIAENNEQESGLLYPNPQWYVFADKLLDEMKMLWELNDDEMKDVYTDKRDSIENKENQDA